MDEPKNFVRCAPANGMERRFPISLVERIPLAETPNAPKAGQGYVHRPVHNGNKQLPLDIVIYYVKLARICSGKLV
jgi:hypothetical protein